LHERPKHVVEKTTATTTTTTINNNNNSNNNNNNIFKQPDTEELCRRCGKDRRQSNTLLQHVSN